jgi:hypothetical protein
MGIVVTGIMAILPEGAMSQGDKKKGIKSAPYVHAVFFYLKKDAPKKADDSMIADAHILLAKIPSVKGVWAGRPAEKHTPKVAVTGYEVGLLVLFENANGLFSCLDHDLHTQYVNKHEKHIEKVVVYDFLNQKN